MRPRACTSGERAVLHDDAVEKSQPYVFLVPGVFRLASTVKGFVWQLDVKCGQLTCYSTRDIEALSRRYADQCSRELLLLTDLSFTISSTKHTVTSQIDITCADSSPIASAKKDKDSPSAAYLTQGVCCWGLFLFSCLHVSGWCGITSRDRGGR
jgi:hypothetical protein